MDDKEINIILKYKRSNDSWLCPECDTENSITLGKCVVCGCRKTSTTTILKRWTEADEGLVTETPKETPIFKDGEEDTHTPEEKSNKNKIIWGIIVAIIVIGIIVAVVQANNSSAYANAVNEFNNGNYKIATEMFEKLPNNYKDVSNMICESKYKCAMEYLDSGDYTSAESLFKDISSYGDSGEKIKECRYKSAYSLLTSGNYTEAKSIFENISSYSDAQDMVSECDYLTAVDYKNNGNYVQAMKAFKDLDSYKDSSAQFNNSENLLISQNKRSGYYNETSMFGKWSDSLGNYVTYTNTGNGNANTSYNLDYTEGQFFKLTNGVHYHGNDYSGWKKQWIFQYIDSNNVQVYDYINGQIYNLSKS